jgi:hypothetical protein
MEKAPEMAQYKIDFNEADIEVDGILSYAWMAKEKLCVFPHLKAMALDLPVTTLLHGKGGNPGKPVGTTRLIGEDQEISTVPMQQARTDRRPELLRKEWLAYKDYTEEEMMKMMEKNNSWEGDPDELDLEAEIQAMDLRVPHHGLDWKAKKLSRGERRIFMTNLRNIHSVQRFCDHMRIRLW